MNRKSLTGQAVRVLGAAVIVLPAHLSDKLVAGREDRNRDEGDEEGESRGDMPPAEDDAQVRSIPGEQHLWYILK